MKVAVVGGTGFIGKRLCRELDERGHDVTALSRHPDDSELPDSVSNAEADVTDPGSLKGKFGGRDVVVNLVALSPMTQPRGGDQRHMEVHLGGTENLVAEAEEKGVEAFFQMSAAGADPSGPTYYSRAKGLAEEVVKGSDMEWTVFRPSVAVGEGSGFQGFLEKFTTPFVTVLPGAGTRFQPIWVGDLVPMLASAVEGDGHRGSIYEVGGPDRLTLAEITKIFYRGKGLPVGVIPVPRPLLKVGLGIADPLPFVPFGRDQYRSLGLDNTLDQNDVDAFGVDPEEMKSFEEVYG